MPPMSIGIQWHSTGCPILGQWNAKVSYVKYRLGISLRRSGIRLNEARGAEGFQHRITAILYRPRIDLAADAPVKVHAVDEIRAVVANTHSNRRGHSIGRKFPCPLHGAARFGLEQFTRPLRREQNAPRGVPAPA